MVWYAWKWWRLAWALNEQSKGSYTTEGFYTWRPVLGTRLMYRTVEVGQA